MPPKISQRAIRTSLPPSLTTAPPSSPSRPPPFPSHPLSPFPFESPRQGSAAAARVCAQIFLRFFLPAPIFLGAGPLRFQSPSSCLADRSLLPRYSRGDRSDFPTANHAESTPQTSSSGTGLDWIGLVVDLLLRGRTRPSSSPKLGHAHARSRSSSRAAAPPPLLLDQATPTPHPTTLTPTEDDEAP